MRYILLLVCAVVFANGAYLAANWSSVQGHFAASPAPPAENQAPELAHEIGAGAYHLLQCGRSGEVEDLKQALNQVPENFRAQVKVAFSNGMESARLMNIAYTKEICAQFG